MGNVVLPVIAGLSAGIALIIIFIVSIPPSTAPVEMVANTTNENDRYEIIRSSFDGSNSLFPDMFAVERNEPEALDILAQADQHIKSCDNWHIGIGYGLGSMRIYIVGLDAEQSCSMIVAYEIEMGGAVLDCNMPLEVLATWNSWKNLHAPELEEIKDYCTKIRSIGPFDSS
jgi:hypothetical protein